LVLSETAGIWSAGVEASLPANATTGANQDVSLDAVSCPSPGNCSAVGNYNDSSGNGDGLLLTETGGLWATGVQATLAANAVHSNQSVSLKSVSCASPGNCSAVGTYLDRSGTDQGLLLSQAAGAWAAGVEAALPANAATKFQAVVPGAVSCPSAGNCIVAGNYYDRSGNIQGLLLDERASRWATGIEAALPANAATTLQSVLLNSVSCLSAGNCTAVGRYIDRSGNGQGLLLTEALRLWASAVDTGLPAYAYLASVSCPSGQNHSCIGTGSYRSSSGSTQGLLMGIAVNRTPQPCRVPQLKGKTLTAAERSISSHNCSLGTIKHAASRLIKKGRVISQQPRPGRPRKNRARVNLVVSGQ
jgi:hypothetical protein